MKYIDIPDYPPLPAWHYRGMDGTPVWFSKAHYLIIMERFQRAEKANSVKGRAMRFCCHCEIPIGVMDIEDYKDKYVSVRGMCVGCGKKAFEEVLEYKGTE